MNSQHLQDDDYDENAVDEEADQELYGDNVEYQLPENDESETEQVPSAESDV